MSRHLFWKVLIAFWLTMLVVVQGSWIAYRLVWDTRPSMARMIAETEAPEVLAAARISLQLGGAPAYQTLLAAWPQHIQHSLWSGPLAQAPPVPDHVDALSESVRLPDGQDWLLTYQFPSAQPLALRKRDIFYLPTPFLIFATLGGLLFSAGLSLYYTRPIETLRQGFARLTSGDLSVRLTPHLGRRRDEITALAGDFDRMAERLQQLLTAREQLLHDVSHELRSPLTRLSQAVELLRVDQQRVPDVFERLSIEIHRLDELVGELLSLARTENAASVSDQYFDLRELLQLVVEDATYEATFKQVSITVHDSTDQETLVKGSAELMRRTLENVLRNAIQASSTGQHIEVLLQGAGPADGRQDGMEIIIGDEATGVPEETLESIFDPFVRLGETGTFGGHGLGLSIARRALQSLGGTITAHNRAPHGLAFRLFVPRVELLPAAGCR